MHTMYTSIKKLTCLLLALVLLTGCTKKPGELSSGRPLISRRPSPQRVAAVTPAQWRQATIRLLSVSWVRGPEGAGYVELPPLPRGEVTKMKLYTSAWTAALLHQAGIKASAEQIQSMHGWVQKLVDSNFNHEHGFPTLHNVYLYHLLQTSLDQPVDRAACLRALVKLRHPNGLYGWEEGGEPELDATQVATELLVALDVNPEVVAPTRQAVLQLLRESHWQEETDAKVAILEVGGPLLLAAHYLGLPLGAEAKEFVDRWNEQLHNPPGTGPLMVEVLLQLARLNQVFDQPLSISSTYLDKLQSLRTTVGAFSIQPGLEMDPQYTYKIQQLLLLAANISPKPDAALHARGRFWGDSWMPYMQTQPNVVDTYHGLLVARLLGQPIPDEQAVAEFLLDRIRTITATQPAAEELPGASRELNYSLRARELLANPFPLPDELAKWVETALHQALVDSQVRDVRAIAFLTEVSSHLGVQMDPKAVVVALQNAPYEKADILDVAFMLSRVGRILDLPADAIRQHPAVQAVLDMNPSGGGYRAVENAPTPDVSSTYKAVEVLKFFAPKQADAMLPAVRDFVYSLQDPDGGVRFIPGGATMLRSTAEGLLLLGM